MFAPMVNAKSASAPIIKPSNIIVSQSPSANKPFFGERGGLSIISLSGVSSPKAIAGSESVTRFTHKSCIAVSGDDQPNIIPENTVRISPMLLESKNCTAFLMLEKILLPSRTAYIMVAKLSSVSTISEADFATSVPVMPILHPISAAESAGASFTPSPVIATISPLALSAFTIFILWLGVTRANMLY